MNEEIRAIELEALKIDAQAILTEVLGMKYMNEKCLLEGKSLVYGLLDFSCEAEKLEEIAEKIRSLGS